MNVGYIYDGIYNVDTEDGLPESVFWEIEFGT